MKKGSASNLLVRICQFLPVAAALLLLWSQLTENSTKSPATRILLVTGVGVILGALTDGISLKGRVERLEKLLTSLDPASAAYRKEITEYDNQPSGQLIILPERHETARVIKSINRDS